MCDKFKQRWRTLPTKYIYEIVRKCQAFQKKAAVNSDARDFNEFQPE